MAPILNDSETLVAATTPSAPAAPPAKSLTEAPTRPQPVALEIPITVNGARTVDGSDKREPFSESTVTVLVFPQGAVIRISTPLVAGQLIFLTNENSKKEVVCQVVKSKTAGAASAYVELKFTEPAAGFWGLLAPAVSASPAVPPPAMPAAPAASKAIPPAPPLSALPIPPQPPAPAATFTPPAKPVVMPPPPVAISEPPAPQSVAPTNRAPVSPLPPCDYSKLINDLMASPATPASHPPSEAAVPDPPAPSSEDLKLQAAGLQAKLGSLLFTKIPAAPPVLSTSPTAPRTDPPVSGLAKRVLEAVAEEPKSIVKNEPIPFPPSRKHTSAPLTADEEEVKIPAWLAPVAQDPDSSAADHAASSDDSSDSGLSLNSEDSSGAAVFDGSHRPQTAVFGGQLLGESFAQTEKSSSTGSRKGIFLGLAAAAVVLLAGASWYYQQNYGGASPLAAFTHTGALSPVASAPVSQAPAARTVNPLPAAVSPASALPSKPLTPVPAQPASAAAPELKISKPVPDTAPVELPNKPILGDVHLATPVVSHAADSQQVGDAVPSIDTNASSAGADPLAVAAHSKGPAAPVPVGGDVKAAQLIKSVAPVYPQIAKTQHIFGNVLMDALIDASGNVSSVKVISGPPVLYPAAVDAVKQWKYSPALLDGQPTPMHLTVTVQFHSQ